MVGIFLMLFRGAPTLRRGDEESFFKIKKLKSLKYESKAVSEKKMHEMPDS